MFNVRLFALILWSIRYVYIIYPTIRHKSATAMNNFYDWKWWYTLPAQSPHKLYFMATVVIKVAFVFTLGP